MPRPSRCAAFLVPRPGTSWRRGGAAAPLSGRPCLRFARGRARVPRVRARVDDGRRRVPRAGRGRATCARSRRAARARAAGAAGDALVRRRRVVGRRRRFRRTLLVSGPPAGSSVRAASPVAPASRRDRVRHGRHVDRRLPVPWAGLSARGPRRASRSGFRPSTSIPSAPAEARSPGETRAGRSTSGPEPAGGIPGLPVTAAAAPADGHRREPPARPPPSHPCVRDRAR